MGKVAKEPVVDAFDEVVAVLIEGVDLPLDGGDDTVGGGGVPRHILLVPESEVGAVLLFDEARERVV